LAVSVLLTGCSFTRATFTTVRPDGTRVEASYFSGRDLVVVVETNGTLRVEATASTVIDAQNRALGTAVGAAVEAAIKTGMK
jgi:hypothetical protein